MTLLFLILVHSFLHSLKFPDTTKIGFPTALVLGLGLVPLSLSSVYDFILLFNVKETESLLPFLCNILFILPRGGASLSDNGPRLGLPEVS